MIVAQDIKRADALIKTHFNNNSNGHISAIFNRLRKHHAFTFFGDYPLYAEIVKVMREMGIRVTRARIQTAIRKSKELKGRPTLTTALLNPSI